MFSNQFERCCKLNGLYELESPPLALQTTQSETTNPTKKKKERAIYSEEIRDGVIEEMCFV